MFHHIIKKLWKNERKEINDFFQWKWVSDIIKKYQNFIQFSSLPWLNKGILFYIPSSPAAPLESRFSVTGATSGRKNCLVKRGDSPCVMDIILQGLPI